MTDEEVKRQLLRMPAEFAFRWCYPTGGCSCMGCASQPLSHDGVTEEQWRRVLLAMAATPQVMGKK